MPLNVPKFMNALVADLQSDAWDRDVRMVLDASTPMHCDADEAELQSALTTLLTALVHASKPDSSITVVTAFDERADGGVLQLTVTAAGLRTTDLAPSLQPVRALATDLTGSVAVTSEPGRWTCNLELPARQGGAAQSRIAVVVDDDVDMQDFLRVVLEARGFQVIAVNDGFDALIVIERYQPQVVLTDVLMPNMNGIDLVGRIKAVRQDLPVIVFSGYYDSLVKKSAQFGSSLPDYVLPKPMTQLEVMAAIETVLGRS